MVTKEKVKRILEQLDIIDPIVTIIDQPGVRILVQVVSPSFESMDEGERQSLVWGKLLDNLPDHESRWVEVVFTDSPAARLNGTKPRLGRPRPPTPPGRKPAPDLPDRWSDHVPTHPPPGEAGRLARMTVTLYTRAWCCCCRAAREVLREYQESHGFAIEEVDASDPSLVDRIGPTVPVVAVDGKVRFRGEVNRVPVRNPAARGPGLIASTRATTGRCP